MTDRWYVTNGEQAVGPVNLDLLARGIESGKVPLDSFVRNEAWKVWRPLSDVAMVTVAGAPPAAGELVPGAQGGAGWPGGAPEVDDQASTPALPDVSTARPSWSGAPTLPDDRGPGRPSWGGWPPAEGRAPEASSSWRSFEN